MQTQQIISLIVRNYPGVLQRVTSLFTRRGFNIESLTVSETSQKEYSRMTIVINGDNAVIKQFISQVLKIADVKKAVLLPENAVKSELMLIKVSGDKSAIANVAEEYNLTIKDITDNTITVLAVGTHEKLLKITDLFSQFKVLELVRTGLTALQKGEDFLIHEDI